MRGMEWWARHRTRSRPVTLPTLRFIIPGRPCVRRPGVIDFGPLLRRQRALLAGDPLDRQRVDGDDIEAREETLRPYGIRLAVFLHQHFAKALLDVALLD